MLAPLGFKWTPGQHCFVRIPGISWLDSHPFTISNAESAGGVDPETRSEETIIKSASDVQVFPQQRQQSIVLLARARSGFTSKLSTHAASDADLLSSAWIDGPYGGVGRPLERLCDTMILFAGGTGITACLPWLKHVVHARRSGSPVRCRKVVLVWVMRNVAALEWVERELKALPSASSGLEGFEVVLDFHVTSRPETNPETRTRIGADEEASGKASLSSNMQSMLGKVTYARPNMLYTLNSCIQGGSTAVVGCGPRKFNEDVANACAASQSRVLRGEIAALEMHLAVFGW